MTFVRSLLIAAALTCLSSAVASAHTICRADGVCFNTSGTPIPYYQQPAYRGGFAADGYRPRPYPYHRRRQPHQDREPDFYDNRY